MYGTPANEVTPTFLKRNQKFLVKILFSVKTIVAPTNKCVLITDNP